MTREEFVELSAGHALHALSPDDETRFSEALAAHPEWADDVRADGEAAALLGGLTPPLAPPLELRADLLDRIAEAGGTTSTAVGTTAAAESSTVSIAAASAEPNIAASAEPNTTANTAASVTPAPNTGREESPRRTSAARRGWFALAASLVILLVIGGVAAIVAPLLLGGPNTSTLAQIQRQPDAQTATATVSGGGTATAHWSGSLGKAALVSAGMPTISSDQVFELWFVRDATAVPAGTFTASEGKATAVLEGEMHAGDAIAVTVEQDGGSPTGSPTTSPIVSIPTG